MILAAALTTAGSITAALIKRTDKTDGIETSLVMHIKKDRLSDREFLRGAINNAILQLSDMLQSQTKEIVIALKTENLRESVRDVQAHVKVLENLLVHQDVDERLRTELVQSILIPLEVGIHRVQFGDLEGTAEAIRDACLITGLSSLLAAYGFLGQDRPILREQLRQTATNAQYKLLDGIARRSIEIGTEIPWKRLLFQLPVEGAHDLATVYKEMVGSVPVSPFDIDALTVPQIRKQLKGVHDLVILEDVRKHEFSNKNRTGAINAIDSRMYWLKRNSRH
ncbi:hypothetical protein DSCOOX_49160 [Desulfosarcina ovata subsp. ovata]|uniref:Uncharacterized protein n=2 Tax=Desulfosarcina ovata TaxID=83564 RepID=A0A5K8AGY0_9BACT|nr:hypothetical protein DSCOOX_49160 [Desulfosarcina ovata subsp. ovata]